MMKYFRTFILLFTFIFPCLAQKVKPALNLSKGSTYYMASTATSENTQSVNGRQIKLNLTLLFKMAFTVTGVTDSIYQMEVTYQSLNMKMQQGDQVIEMDSKRNDSTDVASQLIKAMMNKPFNISITKSGKIRAVENIENIIEGIFDNFPIIEPAKKLQLKSQFIQSFGAKALRGNLEISTAIFPEIAVNKNDNWTVNSKLESITTADITTNYQLIDIQSGYYQIHGDGIITGDKHASPTTMDGLPVKYNVAGTTMSDIKADRATGWVTELKLKQLINGSVEIEDNPKVPGGLTIPMVIKVEQVITN